MTDTSTTLEFNRTGNQVISGSSSTTFRNLTVNKTAGSLTLAIDATVGTSAGSTGTLSLQQGNLTTSGNTMIIAAGGSVSRPAGTPGFVEGNLRKQISSNGTVTRTYEVGT